jgi:superfamily II RNA helicase
MSYESTNKTTNESKNETSKYLSIFTDKICNNIILEDDIAYNFPYKLDAFQLEGIYRIHIGQNVLITAHTGSGKTVLAIYAIAHCIKNNKKVIYTSPTKSLSNQKYAEFTEMFGKDQDGVIGIMTGDIKMNPDAQCIIMTTEILRNMLYKREVEETTMIDISQVGAVIFDEVHYINDPDRGKVWEESIVLLPREITLVMLSASIDKPEVFAGWIGNIKEKPISLIPTSHRVVPLRHYFWNSYIFDNNGKDEVRWEMMEILDEKGKFKNYDIIRKNKVHNISSLMDNLVNFLVENNYTPALFFKLSRKKCESVCKMVRKNLLNADELIEIEKTFNYYMREYKSIYEVMPQYQDVYKQVLKGVVYHHSGLIPVLKEIIEILYSKSLIKILFATETFSIGVNMPTKTVLFSDLEKYSNTGMRLLRTDEYLQMSGRAGRRGLDKFGSVIILPTMVLPDEKTFRNMLTGKSPMLNSKFKLTYQFVLRTLNSGKFDANHFLENTLISNENEKKAIGVIMEKNELSIKLNDMIETNFNEGDGEYDKLTKYHNLVSLPEVDSFFTIKKKKNNKKPSAEDIEKKNIMDSITNFEKKYEIYKETVNIKKEISALEDNIWYFENELITYIYNIIQLLEENDYYVNKQITKKGIVASEINECNEILFTEMIFKGLLDDLEFPEICAILISFLNETDRQGDEIYISDLKVNKKVTNVLTKLKKMGEEMEFLEDKYKIYIGSDYTIYLDFIEPVYIWAKGGTIQEVYNHTTVYDGNFVKAIMRLNNLCENVFGICKAIERFDICSKMENYKRILIRDVTTIHSLYIS